MYLGPNKSLVATRAAPPTTSNNECRSFTYNPADPTPSVGGNDFHPKVAGNVEQGVLLSRPDVVWYAASPAAAKTKTVIIGAVTCHFHIRTSVPFFDVFVRLCVDDGLIVKTPRNICEGYRRFTPQVLAASDDGSYLVTLEMADTCFVVAPGNVLRLMVCGGAHPMYLRNLGVGGSLLGSHETGVPCQFDIFHDGLSFIEIPTVAMDT